MKTNIKMRVTPEQSEAVQKIIFANGGEWIAGGPRVRYTHEQFLYLNMSKLLGFGRIEEKFKLSGEEEIDADIFIRTNGTCEDQKAHPHAELMAEYAKDAAETDRPWERWEYKLSRSKCWITCPENPDWYTTAEYRRKPQRRTVTMPDGTVLPEPVLEKLKRGDEYFIASVTSVSKYAINIWMCTEYDNELLKRGIINRTKEDAKAWAEYLLSLTQRS